MIPVSGRASKKLKTTAFATFKELKIFQNFKKSTEKLILTYNFLLRKCWPSSTE